MTQRMIIILGILASFQAFIQPMHRVRVAMCQNSFCMLGAVFPCLWATHEFRNYTTRSSRSYSSTLHHKIFQSSAQISPMTVLTAQQKIPLTIETVERAMWFGDSATIDDILRSNRHDLIKKILDPKTEFSFQNWAPPGFEESKNFGDCQDCFPQLKAVIEKFRSDRFLERFLLSMVL